MLLCALLVTLLFSALSGISHATISPPPPPNIGVTGLKLIFSQLIATTSGTDTIDYYWTWNAPYVTYSGATPTVSGTLITTTATTLWGVVVMPSSLTAWNTWIGSISNPVAFTFWWMYDLSDSNYDGIWHSIAGAAIPLNVHSGDINGATVIFPYLGADYTVNIKDIGLVVGNWQRHILPGSDPTLPMARADINGNGVVNIGDMGYVVGNWPKVWTNTPPP